MIKRITSNQSAIKLHAGKQKPKNGLPDFLAFHREELSSLPKALENPGIFSNILITGPGLESNLTLLQEYISSLKKNIKVICDPHPGFLTLAGFPGNTEYRPGKMAEADGGYLLLPMRALTEDSNLYFLVKEVLQTGKIDFLTLPEMTGSKEMNRFHPSVDTRFRLILAGEEGEVDFISGIDPDFYDSFSFKIHLPYEAVMKTKKNLQLFGGLIHSWEKPGYPEFDSSAVDTLLEIGLRWNDSRTRLSLSFAELRTFVGELLVLYRKEKKPITRIQVESAIESVEKRIAVYKRRYLESVREGLNTIQLKGKKTGRINGLSVILLHSSLADFGQVNQVSARVALGSGNFINIEREVNLSGDLHDKGVFILQSYIKGMFSHIQSFGLDASILFEQNYSPIDGDSASCAELLAILSALAGLEIPCNIAVTGALSQYGEILPVGSVNTKISAWYEIIQIVGNSRDKYSVYIPTANLRDLNLPSPIRKAMDKGKFQIFTCSHVEELIPEVFGIQAGKFGKNGKYPPGSLFHLIEERIDRKKEEEHI
ncbi:AAA family ATPase [Leptospira noguchii]|uniref:endopeptidase La n=2 Tax=Leptospira noguchii TaxID=28182 RepID=T0FNJ4_9LEPT|nr:AAA family ATPase [Leptospira noguchii]EMO52322.1 AAA domain protein [Leptospira noguchii]EQA71749.1 AAA domain protein [Leptospira noguchii serovar Panama str. CZ214]MCH1913834.1 AAA family ATPase [Leptospira noguchii]MCH1917577.1 AAA family ATPase [Leptospira noguchii]UOG65891.1 AAA family ATPase [Leptospira noguchii]